MRPWLIVSTAFRRTGGQDRANFALASYLARHRREVHLVAHHVSDELRNTANVVVHLAPKPLGSELLGEPFLQRVGATWATRLGPRDVRVVVNGGNCAWPDLNWVHYVHACFEPRTTGSILRRIRTRVARRRFRGDERRALGVARLAIANSRRTRRDLIEQLHLPAERVRVIYYGMDAELFRPSVPAERAAIRAHLGWPADRRVILFVGALGDHRKGFDTLFEAWRTMFSPSHPEWDAELVVIGQGSELGGWRRKIAEAGLASRIRFLGFRGDVPNVMRACDALVSPTRYEAYGLAVHEALCCGVPAVVSADAGVAEQYPPELQHLLLEDSEDARDLAMRIRLSVDLSNPARVALNDLSQRLRLRTWDAAVGDLVAAAEDGG